MSAEKDLLELIAAQVGQLTIDMGTLKSDVGTLKSDVGTLKSDMVDVKSDIKSLKKAVLIIEQDHGKKLEVIFDGLTQHTSQLTRIEDEVRKHDEIILRRVK